MAVHLIDRKTEPPLTIFFGQIFLWLARRIFSGSLLGEPERAFEITLSR
jgi:hypothetical protein